ncbi:MAG: zf-HC2 domain-containing protein [Planctomycetota bacterium]
MDCNQIRPQLGLYLDHELSAEARREVSAHVSGCARCADELKAIERLATALAPVNAPHVPETLWTAIEARLDHAAQVRAKLPVLGNILRAYRRPLAAAASLLLVVGLGLLGLFLMGNGTSTAEASTIDFSALLDGLTDDAHQAFRNFLMRYGAREIPVHQAHQLAPRLNFEVPDSLPGGFRLEAAYLLRFGETPGIAGEYHAPNGEFLAAIFHRPVHQEDYGTHRDYPCVIGEHRGHTVQVGVWRMVHLTDPTTCHCVLSKLDPQTELPAVMAAVAPRSSFSDPQAHGH